MRNFDDALMHSARSDITMTNEEKPRVKKIRK